jgi:hypothetical protein
MRSLPAFVFRGATYVLALGTILILGTPLSAKDIPLEPPPPLLTPSDAVAVRYPELAKTRSTLVRARTDLLKRIVRHTEECAGLDENSPEEARCTPLQASLHKEYNDHVAKSNEHNRQVKQAEGCVARRAARERLAEGLPVQRDAIQRTDGQLKAARKGVAVASADARAALVKGAAEQAKAYAQMTLTQADALRGQIEALKGLDPTTRDGIIHTLHTLNVLNFGAEKLSASLKAGMQLGRDTQTQVDQLSRAWSEVYDFLLRSRLLEQAAIQLSNALGGPVGGMVFRGSLTLIEVGVALGDGQLSQADQEAAEYALGQLHTQYDRTTRRIAALDQELTTQCR